MHIADLSKGMLGANGIVGGGPPLICGRALASKHKGDGGVAVAFFGDGASNQGTTLESLNLASIWNLPAIFVAENNGYAETTSSSWSVASDDIADRDLLTALSPMTDLERLTSPVLFVHGDRDTNVPVAESVQAHQALQALGAPSDLLLLPGEGHTIVGRDHLVALSERVAAWFDRWL